MLRASHPDRRGLPWRTVLRALALAGACWFHAGTAFALSLLPCGPQVWHFHASLLEPGVVLVSTHAGVFRTHDAGRSWQPAGTGTVGSRADGGMWSVAADITTPGRLHAIGAYGTGAFLHSPDDARTGTRLEMRDGAGQWIRAEMQAIAVHPRDSSVLLAGGRGGILRSTDGGASWTVVRRETQVNVQGLLFA